jgi:uncharacterized repeat protein (TIGR01451 family)
MRARALIAILLAAIAAAVTLAAPQGAEAAKVANPGPFNATVTDGFLRIGDQSFGFDPNNPITFAGTINSAGDVNIPTSGMNFPAMPVSAGGFDLTVHINPAAPITGNVNPLTGAGNLRLKVWIKIDGVPLGGGCRVASASSPIDVNALITGTTSPPGPNSPITGTPYNDTNGKLKVVNNDYSVPSSSDCGLAAGTVNGELGLPSAAGKNEAQFELGLSPIIKKGITASLSTSGTSGVRPYTVDFDASASTRTAALRNYQWDFDGNGTFDRTTTSPTTSFTYLTAGTYQAKVRHTDVDGDFADATKTIVVADPPDLSIDSTHTDPFRVGTADHYDLQVKNVSAGPTLGTVTVTDVVPNGLTITNAAGTGWSCSTSSQTVTCTRSSIAGNTTAPNIRIDVSPTTGALLGGTNTATVSTTGDQNPANNTDLDQTTVTAIDLAIDKSHQGTFRPGSGPTNVYTLDVENLGTAQTIGTVTVTDNVPSGLTPIAASGTNWTCGIIAQLVTCTRTTALNAGASAPPITVQVDAAAPSSGTAYSVTNTATVATATDAFIANDSDSDPTLVIDSPDVAIHKSHQGNLTAGSQATYTLAVDNDGPQPTTGPTTVTDTLPTGLTFVSASGTGWNCGAVGQDVTCTHDDPIAADDSAADIELVVTVGLDAIPSVTNTANVATAGDDNPANDSSSDPAVVRAIDLKITKSHDEALKLGREGAFQIDVENIGDRHAAERPHLHRLQRQRLELQRRRPGRDLHPCGDDRRRRGRRHPRDPRRRRPRRPSRRLEHGHGRHDRRLQPGQRLLHRRRARGRDRRLRLAHPHRQLPLRGHRHLPDRRRQLGRRADDRRHDGRGHAPDRPQLRRHRRNGRRLELQRGRRRRHLHVLRPDLGRDRGARHPPPGGDRPRGTGERHDDRARHHRRRPQPGQRHRERHRDGHRSRRHGRLPAFGRLHLRRPRHLHPLGGQRGRCPDPRGHDRRRHPARRPRLRRRDRGRVVLQRGRRRRHLHA